VSEARACEQLAQGSGLAEIRTRDRFGQDAIALVGEGMTGTELCIRCY